MTRRQTRSRLIAGAIGLASTLAVVGLYLAGGLNWLEYKTLDLRVLYANPIKADPKIVCVDIDDALLALVGRWPWSRDVQAALIRLLGELDAAALLIDINWIEPELMTLRLPRDAAVALNLLELPPEAAERRFPDMEMATALAEAGNAFLAVLYESRADAKASASAEPAAAGPEPELDPTALRAGVQSWLTEKQPGARPVHEWWPDLYYAFSDTPIENESGVKDELMRVLLDVLGYRTTMRRSFVEPQRVRTAAQHVDTVIPANYLLAPGARGFGFVVFEPDREDKVVRRQAVLVEHGGHILPQLGLAVACFAVGAGPDDVWADGDHLVIRRSAAAGGLLRVQLDSRGRMLIPWLSEPDWTRQFFHLAVGPLWNVYNYRRMIDENQRAMRDTLERALVGVVQDPDGYAERLRTVKATREQAESLRLSGRSEQAAAERTRVAGLEEELSAFEHAALERLKSRRRWLTTQPYEQHEAEIDALDLAGRELERLTPFREANAVLERRIAALLADLRPRIAGRICLLGYTATAVADAVPTPTHPRAPGVMAHANVINGILSGATLRWTSNVTNSLLAALLGLATTALATLRRPRESVLVTLLLAILFVAAGWAAFYYGRLWVALTPALGAMLLSAAAINFYRYTFVDRERRQLSTALGQYTSKEIARQVAENPELCQRAESREVTAMFTDLQGFTGISERIGAERTQRVLNVCLGCISDVMLRHEAMINKFIGDGVFAFWNPVIYPQPQHARLACETAVDLMAALIKLLADQRRIGGDAAFAELVLRIGVASGSAVVGPCGSEQKYDYTCIGDSVNVASRLESANKFYGTRVLVSGPTREAAGGGFVFRAMGAVRVKGKRQAVSIFELLGRPEQLGDEPRRYADAFNAAMADFAARRFTAAGAAFAACAGQRPDDDAARVFVSAAAELAAAPPPDDWDGAIELHEK